jgi:chitinase
VKLTSTPQASCAFTDSTVAPSQSYFYVATGLDSSSSESSFSNEIKADIPATPTSPGGVLVDVGATKATLTWNAVTGATGYNIWRVTGTAAPVQIGTVSGNSFVDTTIVAGQTYQWFVTTVTGTNGTESLLSAPAVVRPAPPTNLQVTIN